MTTRPLMMSCVLALLTLALPTPDAVAGDDDGEVEREITLDQVPEAAREVILAEAGDHPILEVEEVHVNREIFYEAEWIDDGMEVEIVVTPDGEIVGREVEEIETGDQDDDEEEDTAD